MFSQVSICPQGEVYTPCQADIPWADTPFGQTPPRADTPCQAETPLPSRHLCQQTPPAWQTPPWADRHPLSSRHPPARQTPPLSGRHPPLPGRYPPSPRDGYCSTRYASYWNAFLFSFVGILFYIMKISYV